MEIKLLIFGLVIVVVAGKRNETSSLGIKLGNELIDLETAAGGHHYGKFLKKNDFFLLIFLCNF